MCLAIPGQVVTVHPAEEMAVVDIMGVRRRVGTQMLIDEPVSAGDWVLVHVGFALSRISDEHAREQLRVLEALGDAEDARAEAHGYGGEPG
jgi:hydrogenase expression/formation protein HypC